MFGNIGALPALISEARRRCFIAALTAQANYLLQVLHEEVSLLIRQELIATVDAADSCFPLARKEACFAII